MKKGFILALVALMLLACLPAQVLGASSGLEIESLDFELGVIINIRIKENGAKMAGYYFGSIPDKPDAKNYDWYDHTDTYLRLTKFPGNYYLWLRDTNGNMYGPTEVNMPEVYKTYHRLDNTEFPPEALGSYLPKIGYSVEELNAYVAENVAKAGVYTREGAVVGVTCYLSKLQELGLRVPFYFYGYWPVREYGWYTNPDWGTVYDEKDDYDLIRGWRDAEHERGTHCNGFVHYVLRLNAINVRNWGDMGETGNIAGLHRHGDNRKNAYAGRAGDVLQSCTYHEMFIIDKYDDNMDGKSDGYIVAESNDDEGGQVYCKKPFDTYSRFCRVFDMDGAYYNTSNQAGRLQFWQNFHIPMDAWPDFLREAVLKETAYHVVYIDSKGINELRIPFGQTFEVPAPRGGVGAFQQWEVDLTGVAIERDYVINAVFTDESLSNMRSLLKRPAPLSAALYFKSPCGSFR